MDIIKSWHDGAPYIGSNIGIDPGQVVYWHNGGPHPNIYSAINNFLFSSVLEVPVASVSKVAEVPIASILKIAEI